MDIQLIGTGRHRRPSILSNTTIWLAGAVSGVAAFAGVLYGWWLAQ